MKEQAVLCISLLAESFINQEAKLEEMCKKGMLTNLISILSAAENGIVTGNKRYQFIDLR